MQKGGLLSEELRSIITGTAGLGVAGLLALVLTLTRPARDSDMRAQARLVRLITMSIIVQCIHFAEELLTGFHERFPALLGLRPWPVAFFVSFNLFWIAVWCLSVFGLRRHLRAALFPIWFLALASAANGLAHPIFSAVQGGYFPGLWSSPFAGILGAMLLNSLFSFTRPERVSQGTA